MNYCFGKLSNPILLLVASRRTYI